MTNNDDEYLISPQGFGVFGNVYAKWSLENSELPLMFTFASAELQDSKSVLSLLDAEKGIDPWGFSLFKKIGLNVVSFASVEKPSWYRSEEFHHFIYKLNVATASFNIRLGYGVSMGGFGAAAFSNSLGMQRLLLLYPVASKNSELAPWIRDDEGARLWYEWNLGCVDGATSYCEGIILYDPLYRRDAKAVDRFSNRFSRIRCPGLGHGFAGTFVSSGILNDLIKDFIVNAVNVSLMQRRINNARRFMPYYYNKILNKEISMRRKDIITSYRIKCLIEDSSLKDVGIKIKKMLDSNEIDQAILLAEAHGRDDVFADIFRDSSLIFESARPLYAYKLMKYAQRIRPDGPLIRATLERYVKELDLI